MKSSQWFGFVAFGLFLTVVQTPSLSSENEKNVGLDSMIVSEFIQNNCLKCHGVKNAKGELRLDRLSRQIRNAADTQRWKDVLEAIESGAMPPKGAPQPASEERMSVVVSLRNTLEKASAKFGSGYQYKADDIEIPAAYAQEPIIEAFDSRSIGAAAEYLDNGAIAWTRSRQCITCHTNGTYMAERPSLTAWFGAPKKEVLQAFRKGIPVETKTAQSSKPRPAYRIVWQTLGLAQWDKYVTQETSEETDRALHAMFDQQREDGSWMHYTGVRELPHISTDFELAVRAASAVAAAPGWLERLQEKELLKRVERMKGYLREHDPRNDYELALKLQVANFMPDVVSAEHREEAITMLRTKQQTDGGWSTRSMSTIENWANWHASKDKRCLEMLHAETDAEQSASDPYMTGFAIVLLRESGVEAADEQVQRGIAWLKKNQRQSGRWWMKSLFKDTYHFSTYMGTMQALKALALCGEVDRPGTVSER